MSTGKSIPQCILCCRTTLWDNERRNSLWQNHRDEDKLPKYEDNISHGNWWRSWAAAFTRRKQSNKIVPCCGLCYFAMSYSKWHIQVSETLKYNTYFTINQTLQDRINSLCSQNGIPLLSQIPPDWANWYLVIRFHGWWVALGLDMRVTWTIVIYDFEPNKDKNE